MALFDISPLTQFSKLNNFLWVCWFLGKNLSNFVPPVWKLHYPYCHSEQRASTLQKIPDTLHIYPSCILFSVHYHCLEFTAWSSNNIRLSMPEIFLFFKEWKLFNQRDRTSILGKHYNFRVRKVTVHNVW